MAAAVALSLLFVGACSSPPTNVNTHGQEGLVCAPDQRWLVLTVHLYRPNPDPNPSRPELGNFLEGIPVDIIVQAASPAPGYGGVKFGLIGVGISGVNPSIIRAVTTYTATICWDAQYPVALLIRASIDTVELHAYDRLECFLEDGRSDGTQDLVATDFRQVELTDLIPGADPYTVTQCQDIYVPGAGEFAGVVPPSFPPLEN